TGRELVEQAKSAGFTIDAFIAGVGTGGTVTGVGHVLKENNPNTKVYALEPSDSPVLSGGESGPHKLQGLGAGFVPDTLDTEVYDGIVKVENETAFEYARKLAKEEGILGVFLQVQQYMQH